MEVERTKVLVVDDDALFRRGLMRVFEKSGCEVLGAAESKEALRLTESVSPDLIICDYKMPGMDGIELLKLLRQRHVNTPFILVTAHFDDSVHDFAIEQGASEAFPKPIDLPSIKNSVRNLVHLPR